MHLPCPLPTPAPGTVPGQTTHQETPAEAEVPPPPAEPHLGISSEPPRGPALQGKAPWEELQRKAGKEAKDETGEASKAGKGQARAPQIPMQGGGVSQGWGE